MEIFLSNPLVVGKLSMISGTYNDALMHREGLKGQFSRLMGKIISIASFHN